MNLSGNEVVITGGASGLGLILAEMLVARGNKVFICDVSEESVNNAKNKIPGLQGMVCDLGNGANYRIFFDAVLDILPKVNIVINNAAICQELDFTKKIQESLIEREVMINLMAPIEFTCLFLPQLFDRKEAAIVTILSECGVRPLYSTPLYSGTKAGLSFFTEALRNRLRHLLRKNNTVKIIEVYPPTMDTPLNAKWTSIKKVSSGVVARALLKGIEKDRQVIWIGWSYVRLYHFITRRLIRILRFPGKVIRLSIKTVRGKDER